MNNIQTIIQKQRSYFESKQTLDISFRKDALVRLYKNIKKYEGDIFYALKMDLNKSEFEAYATEIGMVYEEIKYMIKHLLALAKPKRKKTPLMHFPSKSYTYKDPFGCVLIMSPWNYPFQLALSPLVGAIAAGNCVIIKPSNYSPTTSIIISRILNIFKDEYICVIEGGRDVNAKLLDEKFDYIFFTGSTTVGKLVMEKASKHLTPITLELGGKSPCIVDKTANIDLAAKCIVWGKLLNAGQTCVAPDYILVDKSIKALLVAAIKKYINQFYGDFPENNNEYPKIINRHHFDRLCKLITSASSTTSNNSTEQFRFDEKALRIAPAILENTNWDSEIMQEEIFGPILPIISFNNIDDVISKINSRDKPLALYLFTTSKEIENKVLKFAFYGGGCINDTIIHVGNNNIAFGGVGASGMGKYHGSESFYLFSHTKSIMKKSNLIDINIRYAPYKNKIKILRKILK